MTSDLLKRVWQHKNDVVEGFSSKYKIHRLVFFEEHPNAECAIGREKQMKKWRRSWKLRQIEEKNPDWKDLYEQIREI